MVQQKGNVFASRRGLKGITWAAIFSLKQPCTYCELFTLILTLNVELTRILIVRVFPPQFFFSSIFCKEKQTEWQICTSEMYVFHPMMYTVYAYASAAYVRILNPNWLLQGAFDDSCFVSFTGKEKIKISKTFTEVKTFLFQEEHLSWQWQSINTDSVGSRKWGKSSWLTKLNSQSMKFM